MGNIKTSLIGGYINTKSNNEDFALTPYLFGICISKIIGIGICWGHWGLYGGIGMNIPKKMKRFQVISKNKHYDLGRDRL